MSFFWLIKLCLIYLAAFFGDAAFLAAVFGFAAFLAAGFFAPAALGFFGVVAFLTFGLAAFFVAVFFAPAGLAVFALACAGFFAAPAALGFALVFGLAALAILTFFGLAAVVVAALLLAAAGAADAVVVADVFVLAGVATFLADFVPADFERERFFVAPDAVFVDEDFFGLADFFLAGLPSPDVANLNDPLAPLPFVCLKCFDLIPFLRANLRC
jgi:hypothetical protein